MAKASDVPDCLRDAGLLEEPQCSLDHLPLPRPVTDRTDCAAHQMRGDQHPGHTQSAGDVCEGPYEHRDGRDSGPFQGPRDESDRLVADRSSRDK